MKYVLIIAIVLGVLWVLRQQRTGRARTDKKQAPDRPPTTSGPTEIVECAHCRLHLPRAEAVAGPAGHYCSEAHRREATGA